MNLLKPQDWFKDIVGVSEPQMRKLNQSPIYGNSKGLYVRNVVTGKVTRAGQFKLLSLGHLVNNISMQRRTAFGGIKKPAKPALLEIIMRHPDDKDSIKFVNVAYLQSLSKNKSAVFQVASNFNGIESIDDNITPSNSPSFTQDYIFDNTQGPAASISAGGSAICRVHAPFYDHTRPAGQWAQTGTRQVNFLQELNAHFPNVGNGYVHLIGDEPTFPDVQEWDKLMEVYQIGYQKSTQVTSAHKINGHFVRVDDSSQIVDQVFCAALNIIQGLNGKRNGEVEDVETKCKFLLKCAYEGSYLSAIYHNRKKLFLTLIGAGSFGNRIEWIYEAILNAHLKWGRHPNNTVKKVIIVLYNNTSFYPPFLDSLREYSLGFNVISYEKGVPQIYQKFEPNKKRRKGITASKSSDNLLLSKNKKRLTIPSHPTLLRASSSGTVIPKEKILIERSISAEELLPKQASTERKITSSSSSSSLLEGQSPLIKKDSQKLISFDTDDKPVEKPAHENTIDEVNEQTVGDPNPNEDKNESVI
jgi:hypothetical protein